MKCALSLWLLWASLIPAVGVGSPYRLSRFNLAGREYVRIEDWARAQGGQARWVVPKREVMVSLPCGTLRFTVDSSRAVLLGTSVSLSFPVALNGGSACLTTLDLGTTLRPVLMPPRNVGGAPVRHIVLDPGHGGRDPGNQEGRRQEKLYTLTFAREVAEMLTKAGFKVSLTRNSDVYVDRPVRPDLARRRGADLFVSLHFNSADGAGAAGVQGAEVYCMTPPRASSTNARGEGAGAGAYPGNRFDPKNMLLAYQIQKAITEKAGSEDRGVKRARFEVLRLAEMPAVLIEAAFMTHARDAKRIYEPVPRRALAQAIVDGIVAYKKLVDRR